MNTRVFLLFALLVFSLSFSSKCQDMSFLMEDEKGEEFVNPFSVELRGAVGVQETILAEAGLAYLRTYEAGGIPQAQCFYNSVEWIPEDFRPQNKPSIYSLKLGFEYTFVFVVFATEFKFATDSEKGNFYVTPKIGVGGEGLLNLLYGYNILFSNKEVTNQISPHQVTLVCNFADIFLD